MSQDFDYIIIGAGSAGCVLANRLSEDPQLSRSGALSLAGSDNSIFIQMPTALSIPMNGTKYNWRYMTEPEPGLDGRQVHCPRGKVLGGSSSINGLVYMRGHASDFDEWESLGARGWGYANCCPISSAPKLEGRWRCLVARRHKVHCPPMPAMNMKNPLYRAFVEAGHEAGYVTTDDPNGYLQEGFGPMHMTVKDGRRWSTANAYLKPAMSRPT
jgi:choline dehydrogenase